VPYDGQTSIVPKSEWVGGATPKVSAIFCHFQSCQPETFANLGLSENRVIANLMFLPYFQIFSLLKL
jgi:hypothetical protein